MPLHALPDGAAIARHEWGRPGRRPVILLHGMLGSHRDFGNNAAALAERFHVIALDMRSHGDSPPAASGHTMPTFARDVRDFLEAYDLRDVVMVGHSMGAFVMWEHLRLFGAGRVAGLVAVAEGPSDWKRPGWECGAWDLRELFAMLREMQQDYHAWVDSLGLRAHQRSDALHVGANAAVCVVLDQTLRDYRDVIERSEVPMSFVQGGRDPYIPAAQFDWVREHAPSTEIVRFEGSGHEPMWDEPERFNAQVAAWAQRLPRASA